MNNIENIKNIFINAENILILTHINPDGDAVGSSLSLYNLLTKNNYKVDLMIINPPKTFSFLPNFDKIITSSDKEYDLVVVLDTATIDRIGQTDYYFENAKYTINIDHHKSNTKYANYNFISENGPACAQYLYEIYKENSFKINKDIASCLITGVLTDTGGFQHSEVNTNTFSLAKDLSELVDIPNIYKKVLATKTKKQFMLSNLASSRIEFYNNDKIAFTYLLNEDLNKYQVENGDHEGIVNIGREIEGVEVSIFIREQENNYRISLRGNGNIDLSNVASIFNGGGHKNAAGITLEKNISFDNLKEKLLNAVTKELNNE